MMIQNLMTKSFFYVKLEMQPSTWSSFLAAPERPFQPKGDFAGRPDGFKADWWLNFSVTELIVTCSWSKIFAYNQFVIIWICL